MFWKDAPRLRSLGASSKVALSAFLILAGIGYIFGFLNILVSYQMTDGSAGLSVKDVQLAYYGSPQSALEGAIDGTMRSYFASDADYNTVKDWAAAGGQESAYAPVQAVFNNSCVSCHNSDDLVGGIALANYADVAPLLQSDTGKSIPRLISLSHTHLLATLVVVFLLVFVFSFSSYPEWVKLVLASLSFFSIFMDIGSWWLAKLSPAFAIFVIIGGALLGTSFAALTVLGLWDLWFGKRV